MSHTTWNPTNYTHYGFQLVVQEQNKTTRDTGILDKDGNPIQLVEHREPIGFVHFGEKT